MRLFTFPLYLLVLLSAITWQVCCEQKVGKIRHLCGGSFRVIWEQCCGHRCGVHAHKRALGKKSSDTKLISVFVLFWWELVRLVIWLNWDRWARSLDPPLESVSSNGIGPRFRSSGSLGSLRPIKAQQD